jgi:serine/threonine protein kinase
MLYKAFYSREHTKDFQDVYLTEAISKELIDRCGLNIEVGVESGDIMMVKLMQSMLSIIESIHDASVIHRDIKPENFMTKSIVIFDFLTKYFISIIHIIKRVTMGILPLDVDH